jgi:DnaJ-class molecular chaperone
MNERDCRDDWDERDDCIHSELCPDCFGDGIEALEKCPNCGGSGRLKDCKYL